MHFSWTVRRKSLVTLTALILISIFGAWLIIYAAPRGVGVGYDSYVYLSTAQAIARGNGFSYQTAGLLRPLVHFPPFYPIVLSALLKLGLERLLAVTLLAAVLFGVNAFLLGFLVLRFTGHAGAALSAAVLFIVSPAMIDVHLEAMSEPIFFTFMLLNLGFLTAYLQTNHRVYLIVAAIAAALACLSRYVGITLVGNGLVWILLHRERSGQEKLVDSILYSIGGLLPIALWYLRNFSLTGSPANRTLLYHPIRMGALRNGLESLTSWFLPTSLEFGRVSSLFLLLSIACLVAAIVLWLLSRKSVRPVSNSIIEREAADQLIFLLVSFAIIYIAFIATSLTFIDASTKLGNRILSPLYLALFLIPFLLYPRLGRAQKTFTWGLYFLMFAIYYPQSQVLVKSMRTEGRGFNNLTWSNSETLKYMHLLAPELTLHTNEVYAIEFLTGRPARPVPEVINSLTTQREEDVNAFLTGFRQDLKQPGQVLVVFTGGSYRPELPSLRKLTLGLQVIKEFEDGMIFVDPLNLGEIEFP